MPALPVRALLFSALIPALCLATVAQACTGIRLRAADGSVIYARTMEFGVDLHSDLLILPRALAMSGTTASGKPGLQWQARYAAVGMSGAGLPLLCDGVNERGLAAGIFYLPGYAEYQKIHPGEESRSLAPWEVATWILTNFSTVDEVRSGLAQIKVGAVELAEFHFVPPVHYVVHDAAGHSLVVEYVRGQLNLHDNPIGVITNSPNFDWHTTNLHNYANLSAVNVQPMDLAGMRFAPFGQGSGMQGLPGDFTPPSRFVRAVALASAALPGATGPETVQTAFHVLDSFDIPRGVVRATDDGDHDEYTQWTSASDTKNASYYVHTYDNRRVRRVDLKRVNLTATQPVVIQLRQGQDVQDATPESAASN